MSIVVRQATMDDLPGLLKVDAVVWPDFPAKEEMIRSRLEVFPKGQFVALCGDRVVGSIYSQLVYYEFLPKSFTWMEITDGGTIRRTHSSDGDSVYGVGLAVLPEFQGTSTSHLLIVALVNLTIEFNCRQILLGARIPNYYKYCDMLVEKYIQAKTKRGRFVDPELEFYREYGGEFIRPLSGYMSDRESLDYGVLVRWSNPNYVGRKKQDRLAQVVVA